MEYDQRGRSIIKLKLIVMFIVLETHGGAEYATIVTEEDGLNKVFETRKEAEDEAADCQDGIIVEV